MQLGKYEIFKLYSEFLGGSVSAVLGSWNEKLAFLVIGKIYIFLMTT